MTGLRVRLLGELKVEGFETNQLGSRKARSLVRMLAVHRGGPVRVDTLADWLWGVQQPARPNDQVAVLVSRLRAVLGADRLQRGDGGYSLDVEWCDVDALEELVQEAERRLQVGAIPAARAAAAAALALVWGPYLADEPDPWWAAAEQARVTRAVARAHHRAAAAALAARDPFSAAEHAEQALAADGYDEVALRLLMQAQAEAGRPASALAAYAVVRRRLADDLGLSPAPETEALHTALLLADSSPAASPAVSSETLVDLPGRSQELAVLDRELSEAMAGRGRLLVVEGEAGLGKTRLLEQWSATAHRRGCRTVMVRCREQGRDLPLQPLFDALEEMLRGLSDHEVSTVLGPEVAVLGPMLGRTVSIGEPPALAGPPAAQLAALTDPGAGAALLFAAMFAVLRRQAQRSPLALLIDDVHLAGSSTVAWLQQVPQRLADSAVLVVVTQRSEEASVVTGPRTISLSALDEEAVAQVVGTERAGDLYRRSGGHPLFLVELARADDPEQLPATLLQAINERCGRAGEAARTLQVAAVIGAEVDLDLLAAVTSGHPARLLDHLEEGVRRRLLVETGTSFVFAHALIREALASAASSSRRRYVHREASRALAGRVGVDPFQVAYHARLGGEDQQAAAALAAAAQLALARFGQVEALALLDQSIGLHDTTAGRIMRAQVNTMLGRHADAMVDIDAAIAGGAGSEAFEAAAWSAHVRRDFSGARYWADLGAAQATVADIRVNCLSIAGWTALVTGDLATAEQRLALAVAERTDTAHSLPSVWLGWLRMNQGRLAETLTLVGPRSGSPAEVHLFPNAYAAMTTSMALGMLGRADDALRSLDRMAIDIERMGARRWTCRALNVRGWVVRNLGALAEARDLNGAAIESAREVDLVEGVANGWLDLACGAQMEGDHAEAWRYLDLADSVADGPHSFAWRHRLRARLLRARSLLADGDAATARDLAHQLAIDAGRDGLARYRVQARLVAAMATRVTGGAIDLTDVAGDLEELPRLAGLEAWWITGEVAAVFDVAAWRNLAARRADALAAGAGERAGSFTEMARRTLSGSR